jgi:ATP-dependent RNA/DNA helicase IGHMBP2
MFMPMIHLEPVPRGVRVSDLLAFLQAAGGLDRKRVGRIEVRGGRATVEVPEGWQFRLARDLDGQSLGNRPVRVWAERAAVGGGQEDHFQRLARLLDWEGSAEARQALQRAQRLSPAEAERCGTALIDLVLVDEDSGLGGRRLWSLAKRTRSPLPWTTLDVGSPVVLSPEANRHGIAMRGVVHRRDDQTMGVALSAADDDPGDFATWRLDLADDQVAFQRQRSALERAAAASGDRTAKLRDVLLGSEEPVFSAERDERPLDAGLNATQQQAVRFALAARDVALIHGPPGTGKTTAVIELIRRAVRRGGRVLACAPSNMAVDNLLMRLVAAREKVVRLGHPARVLPELREHTLDLLVESHPDVRLARKLVKQALGLFRQAARYTRAKPEPGARQATRQEARELLADARRLENQAVAHLLDTADVLCATTTGLDSEILGAAAFRSVRDRRGVPEHRTGLLDSVAALRARRLGRGPLPIAAHGDQPRSSGRRIRDQLVRADDGPVWAGGLAAIDRPVPHERSHHGVLFSRILRFAFGRRRFGSRASLGRSARRAGDAADRGAAGIHRHSRAGFDEQVEPDGESRLNPEEAALVARKVRELLDAGLPAADLAVIAPYAAQVRLLRELLPVPGLEIDSVDGFQGREKEAVVISLVRSNPRGEIGFLSDIRRMNVAMTRARRVLVERGLLAGSLDLHEAAPAGHHHVHVHGGVEILLVIRVQHGKFADPGDTDGGDAVAKHGAGAAGQQLPQAMERVDNGDEAGGDAGGAGAAIGFQHVAIDGDQPLAQRCEVGDGAQTAADQALDFRGASIHVPAAFAAFSRLGAAGEHVVFGSDPAFPPALQPGRHARIDAGGAQDGGPAGLIEDAAGGLAREVPSDLDGPQFAGARHASLPSSQTSRPFCRCKRLPAC